MVTHTDFTKSKQKVNSNRLKIQRNINGRGVCKKKRIIINI